MPRAYHAACVIGEDKMLIFGGYYTSNTRFNDTFYLKTSSFSFMQPISNGSNLPIKSQLDNPKIPGPKSERPSQVPITLLPTTRAKCTFSEAMGVWITRGQLLTMSMNLISTMSSSGRSWSPMEILPNLEVGTLHPSLLIKISSWCLEDGTSQVSFTIFSSSTSRPKHGRTLNQTTKSLSGTLEELWHLQFPLGSISYLEDRLGTFSKAVIEQGPDLLMTLGIWTLIS